MNTARRGLLLLWLTWICPALIAATPAEQFLNYIFGAEGVEIEKVCWPHDDLWMLRGANNPEALKEVADARIKHGKNEVLWQGIQRNLYIVSVRDNRVEPVFNVEQAYFVHRKLMAHFLYAALQQDKQTLGRLVTKVENVSFGRVRAAPNGDMDIYAEYIGMLPLVRASSPAEDKISKSVTYRVPLGPKGFEVRMVKGDKSWLIDTSKPVSVPLEFFWR